MIGAVASTLATSVSVLYAYSVVGDVVYSINVLQPSVRPASDTIIALVSSNMAKVGGCRAQLEPDDVYCAMLLIVSALVSVAQIEVVFEKTKLNSFADAPTNKVPGGFILVGKPVN